MKIVPQLLKPSRVIKKYTIFYTIFSNKNENGTVSAKEYNAVRQSIEIFNQSMFHNRNMYYLNSNRENHTLALRQIFLAPDGVNRRSLGQKSQLSKFLESNHSWFCQGYSSL